jgi:KaiC/GvpD/RAD55 family RecA-like ATPase
LIIEKEVILKAKEKLGEDNFTNIMSALGVDEFDEKNKKACCPFHNEKTPSFIYNPKSFSMHCFGCGTNVDIIDAFMQGGCTYLEAVQKLMALADIKYSFGEMSVKTKHQYKYPKEVVCDNKDKVYAYLAKRGISKEVIDYADVRQDEHGNIVFNFYDLNDVLTTVKYRPSRKVNKGEDKTWAQKGADTSPVLFNMNKINTSSPLLICEGEIDCLSAIEAGYLNSVSVPFGAGNFSWMEENWDWLEQFEKIIICSDNDAAGLKMRTAVTYRLGTWRTMIIEIPPIFEKEDGKKFSVKDLNEVLYYFGKETVMDLIVNAKDCPIDSVVDYSDIDDVNLEDIGGVKTGIKEIDKELMKLFFGTFNVLTGINGSGKTSFLSQLICQTLEQGENAWLYSGELPNHQTKNWISFILTGQRHLKQYQDGESIYWRASKEVKDKLNDFYRDRLYIYKDGLSRKSSSLLKSMEETVRKNGVKLLIIDNLTAMNLEANDNNKYEKQADLITELIDFAKKFNVIVMMVVHPHKMDMTRRMDKMDIQGAMALSDLAHRVISLYRVSEKDKQGTQKMNGQGWQKEPIKYDVLLDILKDRMRGSEGKAIGIYYDKPSRRFFTGLQDLDYKYQWDSTVYNSPLPYPPEQLNDYADEVFGQVKKE